MKLFSHIKGDISGAISAAVLQFPPAIAFGMIAFGPLGLGFTSQAAMLGIYGATFCCFFAALFGGSPLVISGPSASLSLITATFISSLAANPALPQGIDERSAVLIGLAALCVFIGGAFQALFGSLHLGSVIKYIPYPIISGFSNGIATLLIWQQVKPLIGMEHNGVLLDILENPAMSVQPLTLMVGLFTLSVLFFSDRITKRIPATLMGLGCGTAFYYTLVFVKGPSSLGPVVGTIQGRFPRPDIFFKLFDLAEAKTIWSFFPHMLAAGLALALFGSLLSLLSSVTLDNLYGSRHNSNRELLGQGIGNMVSSIFGGVAGAGAIPRSLANYKAGGRTPLSGMICGLLYLVIAVTSGSLVGKLPIVVFAAIVIMTGVNMFDKWTLNLIKSLSHLFGKEGRASVGQKKEVLVDFTMAMVVAGVIIGGNVIFAMGLGVAIACALFIIKMGKSIIKRKYYGDQFRSRRMRTAREIEVLEREGKQIVIFELQGPLFFGSAEKVAREIELSLREATYCILDMRRVSAIDSTGANIILQVCKAAGQGGQYMLVGHVGESLPLKEFLNTMDVTGVIDEHNFFLDTDAALEWAEDHLLARVSPTAIGCPEITLDKMEIVQGFSSSELESFRNRLIQEVYSKGDLIIHEGDENRDLYLLTCGSVSVKIPHSAGNGMIRIFRFCHGVTFGEMALMDQQPRSANVFADEDSVLYRLTYGEFLSLRGEMPDVAIKLLSNIGKILSRNLRLSNEERRVIDEG